MTSINPAVEVGLLYGTLHDDLTIADILARLQSVAAAINVPLYLYVLDYENESEKKYLQYAITATESTVIPIDGKIAPYLKSLIPDFYDHDYAAIRATLGKSYDKFDEFVTTIHDEELFVNYFIEDQYDEYSDEDNEVEADLVEGGIVPIEEAEKVYFQPRIDFFTVGTGIIVGRVFVRVSY